MKAENELKDQINDERAYITLEGDDGSKHECEILDVFEFNDKEYVILIKLEENSEEADNENSRLVIIRLIRKGNESTFQTIEDDDEFEAVMEHIEAFAKASEEEELGL